jgi:nitrate/nitrite-specific signal transduction histidine kinase
MRRQASLREAKERQTAAADAAAVRAAATRIARQVLPAPPDTLPTSATTSASIVYEALIDSIGEPEADRKTVLRELQRQWHPDKNPENYKEVSTAVFQYINSISQVFLAGLDQHIASMPTPKVPTETK